MLCVQKTSQNSYVQHLKAQVQLIGNLKELQPLALLLFQLVHYWYHWTSVPSSIELAMQICKLCLIFTFPVMIQNVYSEKVSCRT